MLTVVALGYSILTRISQLGTWKMFGLSATGGNVRLSVMVNRRLVFWFR